MSNLSFEPNPFEHSFANGGAETPGGTKLPSVAALTSPASLIPGSGTTPFPWGGSLRTGPLSPAMLSGPTTDYFTESHHLRGGFTPNESSLRTGLTPGGGGSMFPAPSPNSQALFNSIAATPGSLDFHRAAMTAAASARRKNETAPPNITSNPQEMANGTDTKPPVAQMNNGNEQFVTHETTDAANGLFMLAQARTGPSENSQYRAAPQQATLGHGHPQQPQDQRQNGSAGNSSARGISETMESDESESHRPNTRNKGKKPAANGRRKAEDPPAKAPAAKKGKGNNGNSQFMDPEPPSEEEPEPMKAGDQFNANGKKMTDEEKRKNFLERNRVAALKCRQRKKQWLQNLQTKVEMYTTENDQLSGQISQLREEIVALKTMLLAHKDCPVTHQQQQMGVVPFNMHQQMDGQYQQVHPQMGHPYPMQQSNQQVMAGQGGAMNRRFS